MATQQTRRRGIDFACRSILNGVPHEAVSLFRRSPLSQSTPLELNSFSLGLLLTGQIIEATAVQNLVVESFKKRVFFTNTSDSYLDIAGSINDLAICYMAKATKEDYTFAEGQFKRALLMVNRSYSVDLELKSSLMSNLSLLYEKTGRMEEALTHADDALQLLSQHNVMQQKKQRPEITAEINKWVIGRIRDEPSLAASHGCYWSSYGFSLFRKIQTSLHAGSCISRLRNYEEGLIHVNNAFSFVPTLTAVTAGAAAAASSGTTTTTPATTTTVETESIMEGMEDMKSLTLALALMSLSSIHTHSELHRHSRINAKHIQCDYLKLLTNSALQLTSPSHDLINHTSVLQHEKFLHFYGQSGVCGLAFLDVLAQP